MPNGQYGASRPGAHSGTDPRLMPMPRWPVERSGVNGQSPRPWAGRGLLELPVDQTIGVFGRSTPFTCNGPDSEVTVNTLGKKPVVKPAPQ